MSDVRPWPNIAGRMNENAPQPIVRPCDYGLAVAIDALEVQLGSVEAYNRLVAAAERLRSRVKAGNGRAQNPLYAIDVKGGTL